MIKGRAARRDSEKKQVINPLRRRLAESPFRRRIYEPCNSEDRIPMKPSSLPLLMLENPNKLKVRKVRVNSAPDCILPVVSLELTRVKKRGNNDEHTTKAE